MCIISRLCFWYPALPYDIPAYPAVQCSASAARKEDFLLKTKPLPTGAECEVLSTASQDVGKNVF